MVLEAWIVFHNWPLHKPWLIIIKICFPARNFEEKSRLNEFYAQMYFITPRIDECVHQLQLFGAIYQ
jgi:hypothetical protein